MSCALIVICKWPKLGQGKQRIAATLGKGRAHELANLLVNCAIEDAISWPGEVIWSLSESDDLAGAKRRFDEKELNGEKFSIIFQSKGNLGQKIQSIDSQLRNQGLRELIYIGTDAPVLDEAYFAEATRALDQSDVVLSEADDGGVVLMGGRTPWPGLTQLPWSTGKLSQELTMACEADGLMVNRITPGFDVDIVDDFVTALNRLEGDTRPSRVKLCDWLKCNIEVP